MERLKAYLSRPQVWGFFVSVAVLAIISLAFFYPDNFEGNSLRQPDMQQGAANGHEAQTYEAETGEVRPTLIARFTKVLCIGLIAAIFSLTPAYTFSQNLGTQHIRLGCTSWIVS